MLRPLPISRDEFIRAFRACKPPISWPRTIAVANSGGPDSTCLLFLINRLISEHSRVVSLHVNHGLQESSNEMANRCAKRATQIVGAHNHLSFNIPWAKDGFPELPRDRAIENNAREARYRTLFNGMTQTNSSVLALGHHADDQVETSLLRIMKGSTYDGASGMKPCRRWGMDFGGGEEGMRRWIIRPLLRFPKDRLLATCEENQLSYVTDPTNFQPEITLRNAIRHWIKNKDENKRDLLDVPLLHEKLKALGITLSSDMKEVYTAVDSLGLQADNIESEVGALISNNAVRPPVGTYILPRQALESISSSPKIQRSLILRILRYVSPHPWGSLAAQSNRRSGSVAQIINKLWSCDEDQSSIQAFSAGGDVAWKPILVSDARFRLITKDSKKYYSDCDYGWLACRQNPPKARARNISARQVSPLTLDTTPRIRSKINARDASPLKILYDNRFLITLNLDDIPLDVEKLVQNSDNSSEIWVLPWTRWFWPQIVLKQKGQEDVVLHSSVQTPTQADWKQLNWRKYVDVTAPWIRVEYIRPLTTL